MRSLLAFFLAFICLNTSTARGQASLETMEKTLLLLTDYADRMCVPKGDRSSFEVRADIKAELNSLLKGLIDIDPSLSTNYKADKYTGILQQKIEGSALKPAECKMDAVMMIKTDVFNRISQ